MPKISPRAHAPHAPHAPHPHAPHALPLPRLSRPSCPSPHAPRAPRASHALLPLILLATLSSAHAVPQEWSLEVSSTRPYQFTAYHGETLELAASFTHNGAPWQLSGDYALFWQTNGMSGYWTAPASVVSNRVSATFTGAMDSGAPIVYGFLGSTGTNYRAAFVCRFQSSPGASPNALPLPVETIDFSHVVPLNAPWPTFAELSAATTAATNYTDSATNATTQALMSELGSATNAITSNLSTNYYTAAETDDAIDSLAAYYISSNAAGDAFPTYAALTNATVYYSGGEPRTPTRNDYAVVLADETNGGGEWRYIFAVHSPGDSGQWEAQYPIETNDYEALANQPSINGHALINDQTGASLGLLDLSGGTMTGPLYLGGGSSVGSDAGGGIIEQTIMGQSYLARFLDVINTANGLSTAYAKPADVSSATNATTQALMAELGSAISATNTVFSNAVLSVGLNIDSDAVAAINALVEQGDELPISGATTVGALLLALAAAVAALKKDLRYSFNAATVSSGTTPTVTNILDRADNTATLGSTVTAATVTLPAATAGKMRDFFISLTVEGSTAPSLTWIDPATGTDAVIAVGEDTLANIDTGLNVVLFSEAAGQNRWIVSVKHEEAAS